MKEWAYKNKTKGMRERAYENEEMTVAIYRFTKGTDG
jgi:hypothetical protein